jgi:hypothetical protein
MDQRDEVGALTARSRVCADSMNLNAIDTGGAGAGALGDSLAKPELARKFHDNAVRSLPEDCACRRTKSGRSVPP